MNTAREEQFWLTVRVSECGRRTETDGKVSRRRIELRKCPILSNSLKGENQPARGDEIDLSIYEADPGQEDIGSFDTLGILFLSLPRTTFTEFWAASARLTARRATLLLHSKKLTPLIAIRLQKWNLPSTCQRPLTSIRKLTRSFACTLWLQNCEKYAAHGPRVRTA
jgi:hypothetical protein